MGIWDEARQAAATARENRHELRARWKEVAQRLTGQRRSAPAEPPTITLDAQGHAHSQDGPPALAALGQSLLLLAGSLFAAGLAWFGALVVAFWLFVKRLFGLQVRVQQPSAAR
jgi:hypothetical protein